MQKLLESLRAPIALAAARAGKVTVHTAAAGISPRHLLPIALDVGCNTQGVREDPFYIGLRQARSMLLLQETPHPGA